METNSNGCNLNRKDPKVKRLKTSGTELEEFDAVFTDLVEGLVNQGKQHKEISAAVDWFKEVCLYNVPFGKKNRGLSVVMTYKRINTDATESELRQARVLGWCVEWLQAFFLVADDVMDKSITHRGKPCWYKKEGVGLIAINDSFYMENCVYAILKRHFKQEDYYTDIVDLFHETTMQTVTGQCLDLITAPETHINFDEFTTERYTAIVKWKTAFYSFYLPVALAMYMAGIKDTATHTAAKTILLKMGTFFQIQDDYLDCYGDPEVIGKIGTDIQDNKCSWLIVQALAKVAPEQRQILQENYGQPEEDKVLKVKAVYKDLDLEQLYRDYEEESYRQLLKDIQSFQGQLPKEVFTDFASKIYKRQK
ncbi:farnesyl pyrophosphate synthase-like isoform X1 [Mizuhopecten yessoensis]|uniref:Farnesyl pyrophosphate synthase n=1 Tax=Mizuhopecten yessoensis TaxID=6573 RepID=A0A210QLU2_MIZYE|nr:farnesyl pyrophosphate synthase-like isoform X1 [Mizuhopecten yessoensis]OWF49706.1 Farnesyl pyrophosphate synthase [Mizuhopecten yessoensis]